MPDVLVKNCDCFFVFFSQKQMLFVCLPTFKKRGRLAAL